VTIESQRRRPWSPAQIEAYDRRMSATHEAGHAVIARHVGARNISCHIFRRCEATIEGDRSWGGQTSWFELDRKLTRSRRVMVGVAGSIAEAVWRGETDDLDGESAWWEETIMSPTDWQMTGCDPGEPTLAFMRAVDKVLDLLTGPLRAELYATGRRLIADYGHADMQVAA
jgi:hypothetical protein